LTGQIAALVAAYLLGSLPTAVLVARRCGIGDIRKHGSGNPGATNIFRVLGWKPALVVLLIDLGKGAAAVALLPGLAAPSDWLPFAVGGVAVVGHLWPVWTGLHGGKGVATAAGAVLILAPAAGLGLVAIFAALVIWTRRVAAASLACAVALPLAFYATGSATVGVGFGLIVGLLLVIAHRENISRLVSGREPELFRRRKQR
jgi:glycerol-3-phosphate acyltransferase PlsY